jgi:hypothetical protein
MNPDMEKYFGKVTILLKAAYCQRPNVVVSAVTNREVFGASLTVFFDEARYLISLSPSSNNAMPFKFNRCDAVVYEYPECSFDTARGSIFKKGDDLTNSLCQIIENLRIECIVL